MFQQSNHNVRDGYGNEHGHYNKLHILELHGGTVGTYCSNLNTYSSGMICRLTESAYQHLVHCTLHKTNRRNRSFSRSAHTWDLGLRCSLHKLRDYNFRCLLMSELKWTMKNQESHNSYHQRWLSHISHGQRTVYQVRKLNAPDEVVETHYNKLIHKQTHTWLATSTFVRSNQLTTNKPNIGV